MGAHCKLQILRNICGHSLKTRCIVAILLAARHCHDFLQQNQALHCRHQKHQHSRQRVPKYQNPGCQRLEFSKRAVHFQGHPSGKRAYGALGRNSVRV
ncbi:uncharacterized protein BKA78DRAFT_317043 [Phyllosticta capitalensis]|uniref:uncharacterized protein n=1 Tax=Phyllosticta capitalensis TaxID=121624 RepID=UPI00313077C6